VNDDAAEKRRRRQSTRIVDPSSSTAVADGNGEENGPRVAHARPLQQLAVIETPINITPDTVDEWVKMGMDGKINAGNTWKLGLIDYFHDIDKLRNTNDNSINFQKASSTLDGCVKIWTSRVDSVGTETGKLLSNLASGGGSRDDDGEEDEDSQDGPDPSQKVKRRAHRHESTLFKTRAQLKVKKLDLEFNVDPLFRKTCEDFDEGGAHGLLQNHLNLGVGSEGALRVIFDASDSMGKNADDDEPNDEPVSYVNLQELRGYIEELDTLNERGIAPSLQNFSFQAVALSSDVPLYRDDSMHVGSDEDEAGSSGFIVAPQDDFAVTIGDGEPQPEEDFFGGDQGGYLGGSPTGFGDDDIGVGSGIVQPERAANGHGAGSGRFESFDPRRIPSERELVIGDANGGMMEYFDQAFKRNWAGPEHWKLKRVIRRPEATDGAAKPRKEKKQRVDIDFSTPSPKEVKLVAKELFAPPARGAGLTLPKASCVPSKRTAKNRKIKGKRDEHVLPDDVHFSSKELVHLFLKPKFSLQMRGQRVIENADGEVDENFWAQQAAAATRSTPADEEGELPTSRLGAVPFNTQFFNDDDDDAPGFDDGFDGDIGDVPTSADAGEQDLLVETQGQQRRVRPVAVNYTKRAKRVDVRKLKENIWKGLQISIPHKAAEDPDAMDTDGEGDGGTDPKEARVFDRVLQGLENEYPEDKMSEISTSFCFICLLHLANERGLKIDARED
ncbi:condensin complex subunit 2/barren, partial [Vararia minispora EC-137]